MENETDVVVDDNIKPYLDEISERLLSGHAALMVGSGFSKNAKPIVGSTNTFPNWNELGDIFFDKVSGNRPGEEKYYLNPLKLAEEVEALFGRAGLENMLVDKIPNDSHQPTKLFEKLLQLPWRDVFTTNYDTLLERAADNITDRNYQIVVSKEDLINSKSPRIIKLHGSFPSHKPFIITEEDYRTYPNVFAPFVNTVQQSLLENTLCLIGFSGDDPNFLKWIGWIRDHFQADTISKIYLIGITGFSESQIKLLNKRNVNIVDIRGSPSANSDSENAIEQFVDYLTSKKDNDNRLDWPKQIYWPDYSADKNPANLENIINSWKETRAAFPGWRIVPNSAREIKYRLLLNPARDWINYISTNINKLNRLDILFIYEYCWLLDKFLLPIPDDAARVAVRCLEKYQPVSRASESNADALTNSDRYSVRPEWVQISIYMLRYFRENSNFEKWDEYESNMNKIFEVTYEQVAAIHYERALKHFFQLDLSGLETCLNAWPTNQSLPFSEAKRAGLLAEFGRLEDAQNILEASLKTVRKKQNLKPVYKDYTDVSDEAYLMLLLRCVEQSSLLTAKPYPEPKYSELSKKHSERFNFLHQFKCSPLEELSLFSTKLESQFIEHRELTQEHSFRIGTVITSRQFIANDENVLAAYSFLRFCEDIALPFHLPGLDIAVNSAKGCLERIGNHASNWALVTMLRTGNKKVVEQIYNRRYVFQLSVEQCDEVIHQLLNTFEIVKNDIYSETSYYPIKFGANLARIMPLIFSRLCCKASSRTQERLVDFLVEVYSSNYKSKFDEFRKLTQQLFDSMSNELQYQSIPKLLKISIPEVFTVTDELDFPNPFIYLREQSEFVKRQNSLSIQRDKIRYFVKKSQSDDQNTRDWAIGTLIYLDNTRLLTKEQRENFSQAIWSKTDNHGLPSNSLFPKFLLLKYPSPDNIHVNHSLDSYISNLQLPLQSDSLTRGVSIGAGNSTYRLIFDELVGIQNSIDNQQLSPFKSNFYLQWFNKIMCWWKANKPNFQHKFDGQIHGEFQTRIYHLIGILSEFSVPNLESESIDAIERDMKIFVEELWSHQIPTAYIKTAAINLLDHNNEEAILEIRHQLIANDRYAFIDAARAFFVVVENKYKFFSLFEQQYLVRFILYSIIWKSIEVIYDALDAISRIVTKFPHLIDSEIEKSVILALTVTVEYSQLDAESTTKEFAEKLNVRKNAARLAYDLYLLFKKREKEIPQEILTWKNICSSDKEFSEVRIQWGES